MGRPWWTGSTTSRPRWWPPSPTPTPPSSRPGSRGSRSPCPSSTSALDPAVEIVPDGGFYDYAARYTAGATEFFAPARLHPAVAQRCAEVALLAHQALGLRDLSRSDLVVDAEGTPWFLEANSAPGMTETSLLPQAVAAADLDLGAVCRTLVERAAARGT